MTKNHWLSFYVKKTFKNVKVAPNKNFKKPKDILLQLKKYELCPLITINK